MFGEVVGGESCSGGKEWDWVKDLEEDLAAYGISFSSKGGVRRHRRSADGSDG